ncbi:MAG TPA: hypothetical protein VJX91_07100, partial [Candidatus Eisenbacteria bacterium]|nr:hypothetical protein [Candidatus Eisenbacteria bacterium]
VRVDLRDGALRQARSAVEASAARVIAGVSLLTGADGETQAVTGFARTARLAMDLGRLAPRGLSPLAAEELGQAPRSGRVPPPGLRGPAFGSPASSAGALMDGVALAWSSRHRTEVWALHAGRVDDGTTVSALGVGVRGRRAAMSATLGRAGPSAVADLAAELRTREGRGVVAVEAARGASGTSMIAMIARSAGPLRVQGRWRWRSRDLRGVSSEISGEAGSRRAKLRLRLAGNPSGPTGSSSRAELEGRLAPAGQGPLAVRFGSTRSESFSSTAGYHASIERFAVAEMQVASADGRTLTLLASRRDKETVLGARRGTSLGGRLALAWRERAGLEIQLEGVRAEKDGAAWSSGLYAGGATALRTTTRPGITASARGALRLGRWTLGGLVEQRDDASGARTTAASIWVGRELRESGRE